MENIRSFDCGHCFQPIPVNNVQQGGMHIGCYEKWLDEDMLVWKVSCNGSHYHDEGPSFDLFTLNDGEFIQAARIKRREFLSLKEFKGF